MLKVGSSAIPDLAVEIIILIKIIIVSLKCKFNHKMEALREKIATVSFQDRSICNNILQGGASVELKMARCYYYLKNFNQAIKLYEAIPDKSLADQRLLGLCYYEQRFYTKASAVLEICAPKEFSNLIIDIYLKKHDMNGLFIYLNKTFESFDINMFVPYEPLLLIAVNYDADLQTIQYLLNQGAHPWVMGSYSECALSKVIYDRKDNLIQLFLTRMGYPIVIDNLYISTSLSIDSYDDIRYYLHKLFTEKKSELIEKYGEEFYENCYDNIGDFDVPDDITDNLCDLLVSNIEFINEKLSRRGFQIVKK